MKYRFNVPGAERKKLAQRIGEIVGEKPRYLRIPSYTYQIGKYHLSKEGVLSADVIEADLIQRLLSEGFASAERTLRMFPTEKTKEKTKEITEAVEKLIRKQNEKETKEETVEAETLIEKEEAEETKEEAGIIISMPADMFDDDSIERLRDLVMAKEELLKRAFHTEELPVVVTEEAVKFPWFDAETDHIKSYTAFIQKICEMAVSQKHIRMKQKEIVNEKYEFRCFLLRLGLIGDAYKDTRKVLMKNLSGSAAFKNGH